MLQYGSLFASGPALDLTMINIVLCAVKTSFCLHSAHITNHPTRRKKICSLAHLMPSFC